MTNPKCAVCGQINRVGADACEMCDTRLGDPGAAGGDFDDYAEGSRDDDGAPRAGALPTDIPSPHFQGMGDVVWPTLELYRKDFPLVGLLALAVALPQVLLQYGLYSLTYVADVTDAGIGAGAGSLMLSGGFGGLLLYWGLTVLGNALLWGALAYAVVELQRTGAARFGECLRRGLSMLPKVVAVILLNGLIIYAVPAILLILTGSLFPSLTLPALPALLVPWIVVSLMFSLAAPVAAVENRGVVESFRRSAELTKGFKGLLFLTYFLWWVLTFVPDAVLKVSFAYGGGGSVLAALTAQAVISQMLSSSAMVLTLYIFLGILKERRHGFGARAFAPAPAAR